LLKITASQSVGANTRRIEAITSASAIQHFREVEQRWDELAGELNVKPDRLAPAVRELASKREDVEKMLKDVRRADVRGRLGEVLARLTEVGGLPVVAAQPPAESADDLLAISDEVRASQPNAAVLLAADVGGRAALLVALSDVASAAGGTPRRCSAPWRRQWTARGAASRPWRAAPGPGWAASMTLSKPAWPGCARSSAPECASLRSITAPPAPGWPCATRRLPSCGRWA
jgi:alanyl-tRNA synthetase